MSARKASGTVLIRENAILPAGLALESEAFLPGWRIVRDIDVYGVGRTIEGAHWNFFYLTGAIKTIVFGHETSGALRRAVKQILAKRAGQRWNALEITEVLARRFLGMPYLRVTANSRHIQESLYLVPIENRASGMTAAALPGTSVDSSETPLDGHVLAKHDAALV